MSPQQVLRGTVVLALAIAYVGSVFRVWHQAFWTAGLGDWMDPYFINFLMEHWFRCLVELRDPTTPPVFHPVAGTIGYSHGLILFAPFYVAVRPLVHPFQAYGLMLVLVIVVGVASLYLLFRRVFRLPFSLALALTAFFGTSPNVMGGELGIWSQRASIFLVPPVLLIASVSLTMPDGGLRLAIAAVAGLLAALLYTQDFYTGHLAALFVAVALAPLAVRRLPVWTRQALLLARREPLAARIVAVVTAAAALWTLVLVTVGGVSFRVLRVRVTSNDWKRPAIGALLGAGAYAFLRYRRGWMPASPGPFGRWAFSFAAGVLAGGAVFVWFYVRAYLEHPAFPPREFLNFVASRNPSRWTDVVAFLTDFHTFHSLRAFGLLFALTLIAWLPLVQPERTTRLTLLWFAAASIAVLLVPVRLGDFSVWGALVYPLPGFAAIRDPKRIIYHFELAVVLAAAWFVVRSRMGRLGQHGLALVLAAVVVAGWNRPVFEYGRPNVIFDRWVRSPISVDDSCASFFIAPASEVYRTRSPEPSMLHNIDAMFVAAEVSVPTLNGYSAWSPTGWRLGRPEASDYERGVEDWMVLHHLDGVCELDIERRTLRPYYP